MQRHEMEAWLGDDHGLTEEQITELMRTADEIGERYPDPDDQEDRDAALFAAYELMVRDTDEVIAEQAGRIEQGRPPARRGPAGAGRARGRRSSPWRRAASWTRAARSTSPASRVRSASTG